MVFILLIFFAVSTTLVLENQGIKLDLPSAESVVESKKGITISIDKTNRIFIDDEATTLEILLTKLIAYKSESTQEINVILNADKDVSYEHIIEVLDTIRIAGIANIVLEATVKKREST